MPNTKAARKGVRVSERRRVRNKAVRSLPKTSITRAEKLILSGEPESAQRAVMVSIRSLDDAAKKGVIHPNNAARRKSRLMKKLNKALASPVAEVKTEASKAEETKAEAPKEKKQE